MSVEVAVVQAKALSQEELVQATDWFDDTADWRIDLLCDVPLLVNLQALFLELIRMECPLSLRLLTRILNNDVWDEGVSELLISLVLRGLQSVSNNYMRELSRIGILTRRPCQLLCDDIFRQHELIIFQLLCHLLQVVSQLSLDLFHIPLRQDLL